ncbi:MAG: hypothetical protein R3C61_08320 [Bacteroidia bacterium]
MMPTPNAASLGKYGDIPVSTYTGIPNIEIPIYTVKDGAIDLPITLSYHSSGMKVGESASWVGLGWNLNAGGMITRTVMGISDDDDYGYYYMGNTYSSNAFSENQKSLIDQGKYDGEPDMFSFSFNGISGKFYFDDQQQYHFVPYQDYKLEFTLTDKFESFVITTSTGTKYFFGDNPSNNDPLALEYVYTDITNPNTTVSSWYLVRIESADGTSWINFSYEDEASGYKQLSSCQRMSYTCALGYAYGNETGIVLEHLPLDWEAPLLLPALRRINMILTTRIINFFRRENGFPELPPPKPTPLYPLSAILCAKTWI